MLIDNIYTNKNCNEKNLTSNCMLVPCGAFIYPTYLPSLEGTHLSIENSDTQIWSSIPFKKCPEKFPKNKKFCKELRYHK